MRYPQDHRGMMDKELLQKKTDRINEILYGFLPEAGAHTALITEACSYSVKAGGKRLRPMLMQETFRMFSGKEDDPLLHAFMAAIEFIHTYSLVHDDLPAMDDDAFRRGLPTTHAKYGEAFGILAGDALLTLAFETPLRVMKEEKDPVRLAQAVTALSVLSEKAGICGMVGGQCLDVYAEKNEDFQTKEEELFFIYYNKTSALLQAAMMAGAILAGASEREIAAVAEIAGNVGIAFQIRDDILDVTSTTEVLGKPVGSDEKNEKTTYLTFVGMEKAKADVARYSNAALDGLTNLPQKNDFLDDLIRYLIDREK